MGKKKPRVKSAAAAKAPSRPAAQPTLEFGTYTLVYDPNNPDNDPVEIKVRPRIKPKAGQAPAAKPSKLKPKTQLEDSRTQGTFAVFGQKLLTVAQNEIKSDAAGDYASIKLALNLAFPDVVNFLGQKKAELFEIRVTLYVDMGIVKGKPVELPVIGNTKLRIRLIEPWKLSFKKMMWKEQNDVDVSDLDGADIQKQYDIAENGGTLALTIEGGIKFGKEILTNDEDFVDADVRLQRPGQPEINGVYDETDDSYKFTIPPPPGAKSTGGSYSMDVWMDAWIADEIQAELVKIIDNAKPLDELLKGKTSTDARQFVQAALDFLASKTAEYLSDNQFKYANAVFSASYFLKFTLSSAKGLDSALRMHQQAYDRVMANLITGVLEVLFFLGDELFKGLVSKIIKNGKQAVQQELKAEAKTLAEAAAESAEQALVPKKAQAEVALTQLRAEADAATDELSRGFKEVVELSENITKRETEAAEKKTAIEGLKTEIENLENTTKTLGEDAERLTREGEELAGKITENTASRDAAKTEAEKLAGEVEQLSSQVTNKKSELETAGKELESYAKDLKAKQTGLEVERATFKTVETETNAAVEKLGSLRAQRQQAQAQLSALEREHTRLETLVETGQATSEQIKTLQQIENQQGVAAQAFEQLDEAVMNQPGVIANQKSKLAQAQAAVDKANDAVSLAEEAHTNAANGIGTLEQEAEKLQQEVNKKAAAKTAAEKEQERMQSALEKLGEDRQTTAVSLSNTNEALEKAQNTAKTKAGLRDQTDEQLKKLQEDIQQNTQKRNATRTEAQDKIDSWADKCKSEIDAEKSNQELRLQIELLQKIKSKARGASEEEFKELLDQAIRDIPSEKKLGEELVKSLNDQKAVKALEGLIEDLEKMKSGLSADEIAKVDRSLKVARDASNRIKEAGQLWDGRSGIVSKGISKTIKDAVKDRAKKIQQAIERLTKSDFKPIDPKYYDADFWGFANYVCDAALKRMSDFWNWLMSEASDLHGWAHENLGWGFQALEDLTLNTLALFVAFIDLVICGVMKFLEGILYLLNSPKWATSRLTPDAQKKARFPTQAMPVIDYKFFEFSKDATQKLIERLDPKKIVDQPGGKEEIKAAIQAEFKGVYKEYYDPQWERARQYMLDLASASYALNPKWLESDKVRGANQDVTHVLQGILSPLIQYVNSFDCAEGGSLSTLTRLYEGGEWTPNDLDAIFDFAGWAVGWATMIGSLILIVTPFAEFIPAVMKAGTYASRITAALRIFVSGYYTLPIVVGAQFDIMHVCSLAYQSAFEGEEVGDSLGDDYSPAIVGYPSVPSGAWNTNDIPPDI